MSEEQATPNSIPLTGYTSSAPGSPTLPTVSANEMPVVAVAPSNPLAESEKPKAMNQVFTQFMKTVGSFPKYHGDQATFQQFERSIKRTVTNYEQMQTLTESMKLHFAYGTLSGPAATWLYTKQDASETPFATFDILMVEIEKEFGVKNKEEKAVAYFCNLKPTHTDVELFHAEFMNQVRNAEPISDGFQMRLFKRGLHPSLSFKINNSLLTRNPTLAELKKAAYDAQFLYETETSHHVTSDHKLPTSPPKRARDDSTRPSSARPQCTRCLFIGHTADSCRTDITLQCDSCTKYGHVAANCLKYKSPAAKAQSHGRA